MSVGVAWTVALEGLAPTTVRVEAVVGTGLPGFTLLGVSGGVATQAAARVRAALAACGHAVGQRKVVVNLAPAEVPKRGARFDLAIAVAILRALEVVPPGAHTVLGELALTGRILSVPGVLPSARDRDQVVVPADDAAEAAVAGVPQVVAATDLAELVGVLTGTCRPAPPPAPTGDPAPPPPDLADVMGQEEARRALEVAAAGGHHLLLIGPPGSGKSMLAKRLPGILPPLDDAAALRAASVASVAGRFRPAHGLDRRPPFAAPHHTASGAALLGGGAGLARPGAISLATEGVLFLDELLEWRGGVLDGLRQPLEDGVVRLARSQGTVTYPARFVLVAAANPCPCGPKGRACRCAPHVVDRYRARLSGPLVDRLDLAPQVDAVPADALAAGTGGEPSAVVADRVRAARGRAATRGPWLNADCPAAVVRRTADPAAVDVLVRAVRGSRLSARGFDRALRVARTCADLDGSDTIQPAHAHEAIAHRARLDRTWEAAA